MACQTIACSSNTSMRLVDQTMQAYLQHLNGAAPKPAIVSCHASSAQTHTGSCQKHVHHECATLQQSLRLQTVLGNWEMGSVMYLLQ